METGELGIEILHPGGLETTRALADECRVGPGDRVLDVASGTGASACWLAEERGAIAVGVDASPAMVGRAREKAAARGVAAAVSFARADAHRLPFRDGAFDAVISECTLSLLRKEEALAEMARVARPGGRVGFHELCWREGTPEGPKARLVELEGERPETLAGWARLLEDAGMERVRAVDRSEILPRWMRDTKRELGLLGRCRAFLRVLGRWGPGGLRRVLASERLFRSPHLGYGIAVGRKPVAGALAAALLAVGGAAACGEPDVAVRAREWLEAEERYEERTEAGLARLREDFDGDGDADVAIAVRDRSTGKAGIAVVSGRGGAPAVLGAGTPFGNGGDDFAWMDSWRAYPLEGAAGEPGGAEPRVVPPDAAAPVAIHVEKSEAASALIYWNGRAYGWHQLGD